MVKPKGKLYELWKRLWRAFFTIPGIQWIVAGAVSLCIWFVWITCKKKYQNMKVMRQFVRSPVIFAFWHGRSMMLSPIIIKFGFRGYAVSSRHRDGRLMAKLQRMFGLRAIYGSTGRSGAVSVLREGVRVLNSGELLCLSPDGPKGPRMRLHDGVLYFARMTGTPIIPVCFSCSRPWFQGRWDRYLIATPFSKIKISSGNPFYVDPDKDMEVSRTELENIMIKQLQDLDAEFGLPKIEPGDIKNKKN